MERNSEYQQYAPIYDGTRTRTRRPVTDYSSTLLQWQRNRRPDYAGPPLVEAERPSPSYIVDILPPAAHPGQGADSIPAKHLHSSLNKIKHPVNVVTWTPEGRRLLTGSSSGEFTLWNGMGFNFETIMQAHENAVRAAVYSHRDDWLLSADQDGIIKYWQPNFNPVKAIQAHNDAIRGLALAPTDSKFVTASDDNTLKVFDFAQGVEEQTFTGHQWELRSVDWHPTKGLLASASKDHTVKLWDPRSGQCLDTLTGHKNHVLKAIFEPQQGTILATGGKDHIIRIYDLRFRRDVLMLRGNEKDVNTLVWHPIHKNLLSSAGGDGAIHHYLLDEQNQPAGIAATINPYDAKEGPETAPSQTIYPAHSLPHAHDFAIWSLAWHPLGHILASGSNDRITRFWSRPRPGDAACFKDRYHLGQAEAEAQGTYDKRDSRRQQREQEEMEAEDEADGLEEQKMPQALPGLPGLGTAPSQLPGFGNPSMNASPPKAVAPPGAYPPHPIPDLGKLSALFGGKVPPPFTAGPGGAVSFPPPPIPGLPGFPAGFPPLPGALPDGGFPMPPQGFPPVPFPPSLTPDAGEGPGAIRKRGPLPSQQESLQAEMRQGRYKRAT